MVRLIEVDDGYIVAEAVVMPVIDLRKVEIARVMGAVNVDISELSPKFPEKRMAKMWWKSCGCNDADVDLPEWLIKDLWNLTFIYYIGDSAERKIRVYDYVRKLIKLYGVVDSRVDSYIVPELYGRMISKLCSVVDNDIDRNLAMRLCSDVYVRNSNNVVKICPVKMYDEMFEVIGKYAMSWEDGWCCVRKSEAPDMVNELLKMRWW